MPEKEDVNADYLTWVEMALRIRDINFVNPVDTRRVHKELLNQIRNESICVSNNYTIQIEPWYFE